MSTEGSVGPLPYLAAMAARGWTWNENRCQFVVHGEADRQGSPILDLRVIECSDGTWMARYGVTRGGFVTYDAYELRINRATPMEAADEAEAWLRTVLAPFSFPWLSVQQVLTAEGSNA